MFGRKREDKIRERATYGLGGALGLFAGESLGKKTIGTSELANALQSWRKSKDAMPMAKMYGKKVIPVALLMSALGALSAGKLRDLTKE